MGKDLEYTRPSPVGPYAKGLIGCHWSAIFAGAFVTLGLWALLYTFGLALGLSSIDVQDPGSARAAGIGTGIWSLVAPLIALFLGGLVTARVAGPIDRVGGAIHGAVLWGLSMVAGIAVVGALLSNVLAGVVGVGKAAVGAAAGAEGGGAVQGLMQSAGISGQDLLAPVNRQLQEDGKPTVTVQQLEAAMRDAAQTSLREGRLNQQLFVRSLAQNTGLTEAQAQDVFGEVGAQLSQAGGQLGQGALRAADLTGKTFWFVFLSLLLGLCSAVLGAVTGVSKWQRLDAGESVREKVSV